MGLEKYLRHRRRWEVLLAIGLIGTGAVANAFVELVDAARNDTGLRVGEPWILELTSNSALLLLIPVVLWFDRRNSLTLSSWRRALPAHLAFSVVFSLAHVTMMYWARVVLYLLVYGSRYRWDSWLAEFGYEYLKDFRTYLFIVSAIYLYRFVLLRMQGEAGYLDETPNRKVAVSNDLFLVKKLGREFLIKADDIEWVESAGNYVNLHVDGKVYPMRDTMTHINEVLSTKGFVRVHRQAIVNLERIVEIEALDSGDGVLRLDTQAKVPVSRRYRQSLRAVLGAV